MLTLVAISILTALIGGIGLLFFSRKNIKNAHSSADILLIEVPYDNSENWQQKAVALVNNIYKGLSSSKLVTPVSFEITRYFGSNIQFFIKAPTQVQPFIKQTIESVYPNASVQVTKDHLINLKKLKHPLFVANLNLEPEFKEQDWLHQTFDNLTPLFKALLATDPTEAAVLQFTAVPTTQSFKYSITKFVNLPPAFRLIFLPVLLLINGIARAISILTTPAETEQIQYKNHPQESEEPPSNNFLVTSRVLVSAPNQARAQSLITSIITAFASIHIKASPNIITTNKGILKQFVSRATITNPNALILANKHEMFSILSHTALAYLWHIPYTEPSQEYNFDMANIKLMPPKNLPDPREPNVTFIGITNYRGKNKVFGIKDKDIRRHFYIIGKSGSGKTTLLKTMIVDDINKGKGVAVIDPHGDLAKDILSYIPKHRMQDTVYFNVSDTQFPMAYNPVYLHEEERPQKDLIADAILGIFKKMFTSWGPRLEYLLYNMILTVLEVNGTTLVSIQKMLVDKTYRNKIINQVKDPTLIQFWKREFAKMEKNKNELQQALSPIQNKVGRFVTPPTIRNIIGQHKNKINLRQVIDNNQIFIANLAKGLIGEESAALLGSMLITNFYFAALSRANIAESERHTFRLYIDEMQNFVTDAFENILSETRKYGLGLILAHQFLDQLPPNIQRSILGNVGSLVTFTVGNQDARILVNEFAPLLTPDALIRLDKYEAYIKLLIESSTSKPFSAKTVPIELVYKKHNVEDKIIEHSRSLYATPKHEVEEKLGRWLKAGL